MVTTTYQAYVGPAIKGAFPSSTQELTPDVASRADGSYTISYTTGISDTNIGAREFNSDGSFRDDYVDHVFSGAPIIHTVDRATQKNSSIATFPDGTQIVAYEDTANNADISAVILEPNGKFSSPDFTVFKFDAAYTPVQPDVAVIGANAAIVVFERSGGGGIASQRVSQTGVIGSTVILDAGSAPSVAALQDGGYVVAYHKQDGSSTDLWFGVYNADGSVRKALSLADGAGTINQNASVTGLRGGGFAIAYEDNGWGSNRGGLEASLGLYSASGALIKQVHANAPDTLAGAFEVGDQYAVNVVGMTDGSAAVVWLDNNGSGNDLWGAVYTATGATKLAPFEVANEASGIVAPSIAALPNDSFVAAYHADRLKNVGVSSVSVGAHEVETVRKSVGDSANDTITGDALRDVIQGGAGSDVINGGININVLDGGAGDDTAAFDFRFFDATVTGDTARGLLSISGPYAANTVSAFEHYRFADRTIDQADGAPLVDDLSYYLRYKEVYGARYDADDHYNSFGWRDGRDPSAYFSTNGYLGANQDVKAAGLNPLQHYDQFGWRDGRDPSASFDTTLYLLKNADVRAAGIDPLAHFLEYGAAEGRQAYAAIGKAADFKHGTFDAEFYLLSNPDVAKAAPVSGAQEFAYQHYASYGWHEGRNPNAFFDVKGYLNAYADVKSAGYDPLAHYDTYGWKDGRDPSGAFDTKQYQAHNSDVADAYINPLLHYLQYGVYENRSTNPDGAFFHV